MYLIIIIALLFAMPPGPIVAATVPWQLILCFYCRALFGKIIVNINNKTRCRDTGHRRMIKCIKMHAKRGREAHGDGNGAALPRLRKPQLNCMARNRTHDSINCFFARVFYGEMPSSTRRLLLPVDTGHSRLLSQLNYSAGRQLDSRRSCSRLEFLRLCPPSQGGGRP